MHFDFVFRTALRFILLTLLFLTAIPIAARDRLTPFLADSTVNSRVAVIVCPGGSYSWLATRTEGTDVARWLQQNGINAFVLRYRVATVAAYCTGFRVLGIGHSYPDMLLDVEDALRYLFQHAAELHIDTTRIGVMGFSAGGHLAMISYLLNHTRYKPSFICPIYPVVTMSEPCAHRRSRLGALGVWRQFDHTLRDSLSVERHITPDCPPVFLVNCKDDHTVPCRNSELLDSALTANRVPHLYLQYPSGGHGFGIRHLWPAAFLSWLDTLWH